ncbi:protein O-GlcNAcase [Frankliniella occidentalis]|uniref:protein O-GlcNAcase n=1 Tax=Frankliniella occidentalis TaxID=133901 RepID=A0A6J1SDQ0_FRAOC|nr:protein O-GlcNAcase [Frankliniella occidentalis]
MAEKASDDTIITRSSNFTCGVVEGFYGRPWTTEQRKDLFQKLKKWGMDSYVYAPKDDYKHRAYWRELYTVEEAEHLTGLITAAKENGLQFYYALSPGLDITYSSAKEVSALKRKLDQVSQFGCSAFALLFDDIEPEMSSADKEVFQSFAHAQVSVSNEVYQHLNQPRFMVCPTEYCAARAVPNVSSSEYLNTLGSKLLPEIDIMWTGPKVVSRVMTLESIEEITEVMRRPPVLWDNLHANDYDQKRVFLGPYSWRSPELIAKLRGVMTNPNCEYGPNFVGIHTLAQWSRCNLDGKRDLSLNDSVSADIKLETETEDGGMGEDIPSNLTPNMYHPRRALHNAINDWLFEFSRPKQAWGPIMKPQPVIPIPIPVPILPSINTCMSLTTTTTTASCSSLTPQTVATSSNSFPALSTGIECQPLNPPNTSQLQTLAEVCSTVPIATENLPLMPITAPVMNSLASESKIVALPPMATPLPLPITVSLSSVPAGSIPLPLPLPMQGASTCEPMDCNPTPNGSPAHLAKTAASSTEDIAMAENGSGNSGNVLGNGSSTAMQVDSTDFSSNFQATSSNMVVESPHERDSERGEDNGSENLNEMPEKAPMTYEDVALLCDLFYLPFEHGSGGTQILHDFNWLKTHAHVVCRNHPSNGCSSDVSEEAMKNPEVQEWFDRATKLNDMTKAVNQLFTKLTNCPNRELLHEIYPYIWDARGIISTLNSYVKWLGCGNFPHVIGNFTLGNFTWFSKGWKETFMSGEHEPWVFRGGLIADLQRLLPVDSCTDLFLYKSPEVPSNKVYDIRPANILTDQHHIRSVCQSMYSSSCDLDPLPDLTTDRFLGCLLQTEQLVCMVVEDEVEVVGYTLAALNAKQFYTQMKTDFIPSMQTKYPVSESQYNLSSVQQERIGWFHSYDLEVPEQILSSHPGTINCGIVPSVQDPSALKRLVVCTLTAMRANGCFGVHTAIKSSDLVSLELYNRLGFVDLNPGYSSLYVILGRTF